ncbi:MAG: PDZ domain-containing protein [Planctomycetes bacterium]|nr:PDZ domain-containing protein [Planctomycetota bacterium]
MMKRVTTVLSLTALLAAAAASQEDDRVGALIRDLGSERFEVREKATAELKNIGRSALEALRKAADENPDAEVRVRARRILEEIERPSSSRPERHAKSGRIAVKMLDGEAVYHIDPAGQEPITFRMKSGGGVELEYRDAQGKKATASADSLDAFHQQHKDLCERYGITKNGIDYGGTHTTFGPRQWRIWRWNVDGDDAPQDQDEKTPSEDFEDAVRRLHEEIRKMTEGLHRFDDFHDRFDDFPDRFMDWMNRPTRGAVFGPVPEVLRAHVSLPEGQGRIVESVWEGSTASALGLKRHDVLLEIDGVKVRSLKDVRRHLSRESELKVLRGGKVVTLKAEAQK